MTSGSPKSRKPLATHFTFEAKVFAAPGVFFVRDGKTDQPVLRVPLGEVVANVPMNALTREFQIEEGSPDHELLDVVAQALRHVDEVRPGDSVPTEIVDGTASWKFEPAHHLIARGRVLASLLRWSTGAPDPLPTRDVLLVFEDAEPFAAHGDEAIKKAAAAAKTNAADARARFDEVAREVAYVEALRDHYAGLFALPKRFAAARARVEADRNRREEFDRMFVLVERPLEDARRLFNEVNKILADPVALIRTTPDAVHAVRRARDRLHADTRKWRDITPLWTDEPCEAEEARRAETYRLLASHFASGTEWAPAA